MIDWDTESRILDSIIDAAEDPITKRIGSSVSEAAPITLRCPPSSSVDRKINIKVVSSALVWYDGCKRYWGTND